PDMRAPVVSGGRVIAIVNVDSFDDRDAFGDSEERLLTTVCNAMGLALQSAQLFDQTQRLLKETEQRNAELAVINGIQQGMAAELDFQAIVEVVGEKLREVFDSRDLYITVRGEGDAISMLYALDDGVRQPPRHFPAFGDRPFTRKLRAGETVVVGSVADQHALEMVVIEGTRRPTSGVYVPIMVGQRFAGHVGIENFERENAFDAAAVRLVETVTSAMGVALENARLFAETQRRATELDTVNAVSQQVSGKLELGPLIQGVGEQVRAVFHADLA